MQLMLPVDMPVEFSLIGVIGVFFGSCEFFHKFSSYFPVVREGNS